MNKIENVSFPVWRIREGDIVLGVGSSGHFIVKRLFWGGESAIPAGYTEDFFEGGPKCATGPVAHESSFN